VRQLAREEEEEREEEKDDERRRLPARQTKKSGRASGRERGKQGLQLAPCLYGVVAGLAVCAFVAWARSGTTSNKSLRDYTGLADVPSEDISDGDELAFDEQYERYAAAAKVISADWIEQPIRIGSIAKDIPPDHKMTLYHQTSPEACEGIMHSDFRLGKGGWCGKGIYFALTPNATRQKAVTSTSGHGCMLEVVVDVGRIGRFSSCGKYNAMNLRKLRKQGYDSILFEPPEKTGDEVIIFEPNRIKSKKIIAFQKEWMAKRWYGPPR